MKAYHHNHKGMTLIEIMVVIGVLTIILAFGMTVNFNSFTSSTLQAEEAKIVSALERARSHAMANMCIGSGCTEGKKHGVCYDSTDNNYVIFQETCNAGASTSELIPANTNIAENSGTTSPFPTIIFDQLSGKTTGDLITISDGSKSEDITINNEGRINW